MRRGSTATTATKCHQQNCACYGQLKKTHSCNSLQVLSPARSLDGVCCRWCTTRHANYPLPFFVVPGVGFVGFSLMCNHRCTNDSGPSESCPHPRHLI